MIILRPNYRTLFYVLGHIWGNIGATKIKKPQPHGLQAQ